MSDMVTARVALIAALLLYLSRQRAYGQGQGAVRLYAAGESSHQFSEGVVQVYYGGSWGSVCGGVWTVVEADVMCHQLQWQGASDFGLAAEKGYGGDNAVAVLEDVQCSTADYLVLLQCSYSTDISCTNDDTDVYVSCYTNRLWDALSYEGSIRLTGGQHITEGLVEVYCNGQWGTVCDDAFGPSEAGSICRQLGYTTAVRYDHLIMPGNLTQPIWLDDVVCEQVESCIATCQSCPLSERHNCRHGEDITVECGTDASYDVTDYVITTTCEDANNRPTPEDLLSLGAVVGVVVGCVILLFIVMVIPIMICCCRRGQHQKQPTAESEQVEIPSATNPTLTTPLATPTTLTVPELIAMEGSPTVIRKNLVYHYPSVSRSHAHPVGNHARQGSSHSHTGSLDHTPRHIPLSHSNSAPYNRHVTTPPAFEEPTML